MVFSNMLQAFFYFMMFPLIFLSIFFFLYNLNNGIYVCLDVCKLCARCGACTCNSEIKSLSTEPARGPSKFFKFFEEDNIHMVKKSRNYSKNLSEKSPPFFPYLLPASFPVPTGNQCPSWQSLPKFLHLYANKNEYIYLLPVCTCSILSSFLNTTWSVLNCSLHFAFFAQQYITIFP